MLFLAKSDSALFIGASMRAQRVTGGKSVAMEEDSPLLGFLHPNQKDGCHSQSSGGTYAETMLKEPRARKKDFPERPKQTTTLVLCCDDTIWSEDSPLVNIYFRFDEVDCEGNCVTA